MVGAWGRMGSTGVWKALTEDESTTSSNSNPSPNPNPNPKVNRGTTVIVYLLLDA